MTRCGTCWIVLREGEDVDEHARTSRWHAEAVQLIEDRRAESARLAAAAHTGLVRERGRER